MPIRDDEARRSAQERLRARSGRQGASTSRSASRAQNRSHRNPGRQASARPAQSRSSAQPRRNESRAPRRPQRAGSLIEQLPGSIVTIGIAAAIAIVILVLIFAVLVPSCSGAADKQRASDSADATAQAGIVATVGMAKAKAQTAVETANQIGALETSNTKVQALVTLLGEEETAKLLAQAKTSPETLWIAAHPDAYAFEGIETQYKILKLAADEPSAIPFVRHFPTKYPAAEPSDDEALAVGAASSDSASDAAIPRLYQWDRRWGCTIYGSAAFGLVGSGPTALAMVCRGLAGDNVSPYDVGKRAQDGGYVLEGGETVNTLFTEAASDLGLDCQEVGSDSNVLREELSKGHAVIVNMGPGTFTTGDHFIVLAGLSDDGRAIVNDPYSATRSAQTWDLELIATEAITAFSFTA